MRSFKLTIAGKPYKVEIEEPSHDPMVVMVNGRAYTVCREEWETAAPDEIAAALVSPLPSARPSQPAEAASQATGVEEIKAPMPGKILSVAVEPGDMVRHGDGLCSLEAMKMESVIRAPINGRVSEVRVQPGDSVQFNDVLIVLARLGS
jgi:glutaconyl-CoA decarboxylase